MKTANCIKSFIFCFILGFFLISCDKNEPNISEHERTLCLVTANGKQLAPNISALKKVISVFIAEKFEEDIDFTVTMIEHILVDDNNFVALVYYRTNNGRESNILLSDIQNNTLSRLKSGYESGNPSLSCQCITAEGTNCKNPIFDKLGYIIEYIQGCLVGYDIYTKSCSCTCANMPEACTLKTS